MHIFKGTVWQLIRSNLVLENWLKGQSLGGKRQQKKTDLVDKLIISGQILTPDLQKENLEIVL